MALSLTKGKGFAVLTVTSDPGSTSPLLCQILRALCCCSTCLGSGNLRKLMGGTLTSLGIVQIMVGLLTMSLGTFPMILFGYVCYIAGQYWWGACFILSGIISILGERFPSPWLVFLTAFIHVVSAILAIVAIVFYAIDEDSVLDWGCDDSDSDYSYDSYLGTPVNLTEEQQGAKDRNLQLCRMYKTTVQQISISLKVLLMAFAVLQLCVAISVVVVAIKALIKNSKQEVTEVDQPLMEEVTANPVA